MKKSWYWIWKFVIVIAAALVLGAVLGGLMLFKTTTVGTPRLTAGALAQFISHAAALGMLWLLGFRVAEQLRVSGAALARLATSVQALATLIVVASAYVVLLQFAGPFMAPGLKPFVDWAFIAGILASSVWLIWALYNDSEALVEAIGSSSRSRRQLTQE